MLIFLSLLEIIGTLIFLIFTLILIVSMVRGAPYAPTRRETIEKIISLAKITPGMKAADLGSGDGRIVIALAQAGAEAHGYEINPILVWWARHNIRKKNLDGKAFIHLTNFWKQDFSSFDVVVVYGIVYIMKGLEKKFKKELKPGAKLISNDFSFPNWQHSQKIDGVYVYDSYPQA